MRSAALILIIICEIIIALTRNVKMDTGSLSFLTTLVVVVISAFTFSALLRNFKNLPLTKNYAITGLIGVVLGMLYYNWVKDHLDAMLEWLQNYGLYIMLLLIFLSAIVLYFSNGSSKKIRQEPIEPVEPMNPEESIESN